MFKKYLFSSSVVAVLAAASAMVPAQASAATLDTSMCSSPALSQEFLGWGDSNYYTPVAGMSASSFNSAGWTLSGGAKVVTTPLPNGGTSTVLDLPSGAQAVSPISCVSAIYPVARGWVRNVTGTSGVGVYVSYELVHGWQSPKQQGSLTAAGTSWALPPALSIMPTSAAGWQPVKITLVGQGTGSEYQVSDLELDPRMKY